MIEAMLFYLFAQVKIVCVLEGVWSDTNEEQNHNIQAFGKVIGSLLTRKDSPGSQMSSRPIIFT